MISPPFHSVAVLPRVPLGLKLSMMLVVDGVVDTLSDMELFSCAGIELANATTTPEQQRRAWMESLQVAAVMMEQLG